MKSFSLEEGERDRVKGRLGLMVGYERTMGQGGTYVNMKSVNMLIRQSSPTRHGVAM